MTLEQIEQVIAEGPWKDDWDSLAERPLPDWYRQTRLGIFLHWGPFSVPAYHDWYARNMYMREGPEYAHHLKYWGNPKTFGYKDFIPMFRMENFDPKSWAELFKAAGADYVVPVAEHHDGFQNYGSDLSPWNAVNMGPHRDILNDLLDACEQEGLVRGVSSHRIEHWFFFAHSREFDSGVGRLLRKEDAPDILPPYSLMLDPETGKLKDIPRNGDTSEATDQDSPSALPARLSDVPDGMLISLPPDRKDLYWPAMPDLDDNHDLYSRPYPTREFMEDWLLRCCELVEKAHPKILYFDWWIQHSAANPWLRKFTAYYYNRSREWGGGIINYKHDAYPFGVAVPDMERGQFAEAKPFLWQSDTSVMRGSWAYSEQPGSAVYKSPAEILQALIDVSAKNGRLLLNFGPKPDGTFRPEDLDILRALASWMQINGEAVHGTGLWRIAGEGPTRTEESQFSDGTSAGWTSQDFRFLCRGKQIYAFCMVCPDDGQIRVRSLRHSGETGRLPLFHGIITDVKVLGMENDTVWRRTDEALEISLGDWRSDTPVVIRVTVR